MRREFLTLGIETSCDETACAVLRGRNELLSNVISSSLEFHTQFGGIVPEIASRYTLEAIDHVLNRALKKAHYSLQDVNLIAVTKGPGLIGPLLVGVHFAKTLGYALRVPVIGVNHLEAHVEAAFLNRPRSLSKFVGFVVSGGHTVLVLFKDNKYHYLGETVDDAAGEAFDKVAKMMDLGFPGGPVIDKLAKNGDPTRIRFPRIKTKNPYDFSFSGIKTAVLYYIRDNKNWRKQTSDVAAGFQKSVVASLVEKSLLACEGENVKTLVLGGGVSANSLLRRELEDEALRRKIELILPEIAHTMDNAAMTAYSGYKRYKDGYKEDKEIIADPNLSIGR